MFCVKPIKVKELLNTLHDVLLPQVQQKELKKNENIIKTISHITDSKQVEIIKLIINNLDNNNIYEGSYTDIMNEVSISKPTLIKLAYEFAQVMDALFVVFDYKNEWLMDLWEARVRY